MYYVSTRNKEDRRTAAEAIAQGLAADGGLIGLVCEGDLIDINIPAYQINVRVSDAEFEERRKAYVKPEPKVKSGWLERYGRLVSSANTGAVLK